MSPFRNLGRAALFALLFASSVYSQDISRWALGRPSLLIDMPANPSSGGVEWAERSIYSIFPNSWSAEGGGVRVEVARIYSPKAPADLLAETNRKLSSSAAASGKGKLSGREFVSSSDQTRTVMAIGPDGTVGSAASWIVVVTYRDAVGKVLADRLLQSIKVEREGTRHWALRSFGPTFLAAEMPFDLQQTKDGSYESSFDGMDIRVKTQTPEAGNVFQIESTLKSMMEEERTLPGVTEFRSSSSKYKLGNRDGMLITKDFRRGNRDYRVYEIAFIEKHSAVTASIQIDPKRTDHQNTTERVLRTMRDTINAIHGWGTYAIGKHGLYVDLPTAPKPPRQMNAVTIYESNAGLAMTEIREIEVGQTTAHDPDFAAKQYFEMKTAIDSKYKYEIEGIDRLLIDGFEARLVRAKWKTGDRQNFRRILTIYGYGTQWIIDMLATTDNEAFMQRVMQSVRVAVPADPSKVRQSFGTMGVSFLVSSRQEPKITQNAADPDFAREEVVIAQDTPAIYAVYEMVFRNQSPPVTDERGKFYFDSFLRGIGKNLGMTFTTAIRDSFPINIDGIEGRHFIFDIKGGKLGPNTVMQGDFILLAQDKKFWTLTLLTNYDAGTEARTVRGRILNSLRVGI